jgi:hypothetical protein
VKISSLDFEDISGCAPKKSVKSRRYLIIILSKMLNENTKAK